MGEDGDVGDVGSAWVLPASVLRTCLVPRNVWDSADVEAGAPLLAPLAL